MDNTTSIVINAKYVVWVNLYMEGWKPIPFDNLSAIADYIQEGNIHGPFVITKRVALHAMELT